MSDAARIAENYHRIRTLADDAAKRSGRAPQDVTVVAVSKYVGSETIEHLVACGCRDLGESRPQQLWQKATDLAHHDIRWHMVGHLQRNKVERTLPVASLLHSVDSPRLLAAIESAAAKHAIPTTRVLLEVNISGDANKHGLLPSELPNVLDSLSSLEHVRVEGLMGMASHIDDESQLRMQFSSLRALRDQYATSVPDRHRLDDLSMGMSGDFEIAIEEGATLVRVGSALFEGCALR